MENRREEQKAKPPLMLMAATSLGVAVAVTSGEALLGGRGADLMPGELHWALVVIGVTVGAVGAFRLHSWAKRRATGSGK